MAALSSSGRLAGQGVSERQPSGQSSCTEQHAALAAIRRSDASKGKEAPHSAAAAAQASGLNTARGTVSGITLGSDAAQALAVSASLAQLQQLIIDAPVTTADADRLMKLLPALTRLHLSALCSLLTPAEQYRSPWLAASPPASLLHLLLQADAEQKIMLDMQALRTASSLQSLQLLEGITLLQAEPLSALTALTQVIIRHEPRHGSMLLGSRMHWLKGLQQLRSLSPPYIYIFDDGWASIAGLPQLQALHARCLYLTAPPASASLSIRGITVHRLLLSDQEHSVHDTQPAALSGRITQAAPALESLTAQHVGSAPSQVASSLANHTALRSLSLTSSGYHRPPAPAWQGQPLASITSLTSLSIRDLSAQDLAGGVLWVTWLPAQG